MKECKRLDDSIERGPILPEFATILIVIVEGRISRRCKHFRSEFAAACYPKSLADPKLNAEPLEHLVLPVGHKTTRLQNRTWIAPRITDVTSR
jgi:hypothetical protein